MPKQTQITSDSLATGVINSDPCGCKKERSDKIARCNNCGCPNCDSPMIRPGDPRAKDCIWGVRTQPGTPADLPEGFPQIGDNRYLKCQGLNRGDVLAPPYPKPANWKEPVPPQRYDEDVFPSIPKYRRDEQGFEIRCDSWRSCITEGYTQYKKCIKACQTPSRNPSTKPPTGTR